MATEAKENEARAHPRRPGPLNGHSRQSGGSASSSPQLPIAAVQSLRADLLPRHLAALVECEPSRHCSPAGRRYSWSAFEYFLLHWQRKLTAVVFSGDDPLDQPAIGDAVARVRAMGFRVGLRTRGLQPGRLSTLLPSLDWVSLSCPAPVNGERNGLAALPTEARQSLRQLLRRGFGYECHTEVSWGHTHPAALRRLAHGLAQTGVQRYAVTLCHTTLLPEHIPQLIGGREEASLWQELQELFPHFRHCESFPGAA